MAQRGRPKRSWVKLDCNGILRGSINWQLTLEEQAVWIKAFAYSAVCGGESGIIQDNDHKPLPHWFIANELHCPEDIFESMLKKCQDAERLKENSNGIEIINFAAYQFTEYDRQRPYREHKQKDEEAHEPAPRKLVKYSPYPEFPNIKMSKEEYNKLLTEFGEQETRERIERLSLYMESKGKGYTSHYATILSWARKDAKEKPIETGKGGVQNPDKYISGKYGHVVKR